ncbi:MAG TPA: peptide chain release factor-like protein [Candidatus Didemnitutus sp.]|nr:peptide chain release factor-like protein [Candidatus Didemnitutus sp.]
MDPSVRERLIALAVSADDVDERFVLGSGHGGQKIQKTSSSVWLRHRPTGIEVRCQQERSQSVNRELAWGKLAEKIAAARAAVIQEQLNSREKARRRHRKKSPAQKRRMVDSKRHRARRKEDRSGSGDW